MTNRKKERKTQRKRDKQRRSVAKEKRRKIRSASSGEQSLNVDDAHSELFGQLVASPPAGEEPEVERQGNPEIHAWWDRYMAAAGNGRAEMVIERLQEPLDDEWQEALFPEAVFEAETHADSDRYLELLELLANQHRELYRTGLLWFLRSRVPALLSRGEEDAVARIVSEDATEMIETGEAFYGTVAMLRLANLESVADELAAAGFRVMDDEQLMPWAIEEIFHWILFQRVRECIAAEASDEAITGMEVEMEKLDANMDPEMVELRRNMTLAIAGINDQSWQRNELVGANEKSQLKRYLLGYEFVGWVHRTHNISLSAADELRGLIGEAMGRDELSMRDFLDGVPQQSLDKHLASRLGFMSLDRFKAPAMLIAVKYFVQFLATRELVTESSLRKTSRVISQLDSQLRNVLDKEWHVFRFLDRLRNDLNNPTA
jgi:hypothetical protein